MVTYKFLVCILNGLIFLFSYAFNAFIGETKKKKKRGGEIELKVRAISKLFNLEFVRFDGASKPTFSSFHFRGVIKYVIVRRPVV